MPPVEKRIANKEIRRLRALQVLQLIIAGVPQKQIAQQFNITPRRIGQDMDFLEKTGEFEKIEETILKDLYPLAIEAFRKKLKQESENGNDIEAAKEVMKMPLKAAAIRAATGRASIDELTLERYTFRRRVRRGEIIEGEVSNVEKLEHGAGTPQLPDGTPQDGGREGEGSDDDQR